MAGKEGAAAELMGLAARKLARRLDAHADTLLALPPPEDGPAVEKDAKHIKAVADAGRSVVALELAADKAAAARDAASAAAASPDPAFDAEDEMDMDDDEFAALDPDVVARRCRALEACVRGLAGQLERKSAVPRAGAHRPVGLRAAAAGGAQPGADAA